MDQERPSWFTDEVQEICQSYEAKIRARDQEITDLIRQISECRDYCFSRWGTEDAKV